MFVKSVSIIGLGWLGLPLAERLLNEGFSVKGSTTSAEKATALKEKAIATYEFQLNPEPIGDLRALLDSDTLVINIPPKAGKLGDEFHPAQIQHIVNAVQGTSIKHIVYVSSTSVYPELNREVVEEDVRSPEQSAAPGLVRAEQLVQALEKAEERVVTILRCGGLMGYDRIPGKYVAGRTVDTGDVPVNYLHRDDAVGILLKLIHDQVGGTFNAVSPIHPTREAIYRKSCAEFGYTLPIFVQPIEPVPYKLISPTKLIQAIHYPYRYPDPLQYYYQKTN
ncbi:MULTISPECIES: NAD(P)H-binding protein [unclassified Spirosoma]|uniref:NAD(P)H-binding protein n=1 Tax=unclassified Spirosoma TaxID=2621999 RepID=UPI0009633DFA|nr:MULTISPECIES: NAD(P)H-binding protein [unclassified Spirosoma]MBN8822861.1 NAD(P)H-binding protein [Spirosoma sp.]OJW80055.1 MAG: NAD(P)-dependent oxidoreductase [Spirosoma sp. 48-14]